MSNPIFGETRVNVEVGDMVSSPLNGKRWEVVSVDHSRRMFRLRDVKGVWRHIEWHMSVLRSAGWALHKANGGEP